MFSPSQTSQTDDVAANAATGPQKLVMRAMHGDGTALARLHRELMRAFTRFFSKRHALNSTEAEELAHQTASEAMQALTGGRYNPDRAAFMSFAYGVAHKVRLRYLKRRRTAREKSFSDLDSGDSEYAPDGPISDGDALPPMEQVEAMRQCLFASGTLHALTPEERFVVIGRAEGRTFEWLARQLSRSLDTVCRLKVRALEKLRGCMALKGYS